MLFVVFKDRIDAIVQQAERFVAANHFDSEAIVSKQQALVARYENLQVCSNTENPIPLAIHF